jgi:polyphosphate glucokinase
VPPTSSTASTAKRTGFGVDIGGTGIKAAPVNLDTGELIADRFKLPTPHPSDPQSVGKVVGETVGHFGWTGPIGVTFPAVIKDGKALTAANVDKSWIGSSVHDAVRPHVPGEVIALNDADAAGLAEVRFGAAKGVNGVVLVLTLGTGIGSALVLDGKLFPSAELGHLEVDGKEAERRASGAVREVKKLSWKQWTKRLQKVLTTYEALLWPDLIVLGGGVSQQSAQWLPMLTTRATLVPATLQNTAGIVGAAIWADENPATPVPVKRTRATATASTPAAKAPVRKAPAKRTAAVKTPTTGPAADTTVPVSTTTRKAPVRRAPARKATPPASA